MYDILSRSQLDTKLLPKDYFITPTNSVDAIFSIMADKYNDDNYLMIVNKDFINDSEMKFSVNGVKLIDVTTGTASKDELTGNITMSIEAGGFKLFKIIGDNVRPTYKDVNSKNLAREKPVYSSKSVGENGWYNCKAVDGIKHSTSTSQGYKLEVFNEDISDTEHYFMIDLLRDVEFNKILIYPSGKVDAFSNNYPLSYDILVSSDLKDFTKIVSYSREGRIETVPEFTFDSVKARYVKIVFTQPDLDMELDGISFSEIEIYNA